MTWAIGACNVLGAYGAVFSDVQVTFSDKRTVDLVRKAYPVGPFLVGAFAGSVAIGFQLLQSISNHLRVPPGAPPNSCWEPPTVAEYWAPVARKVFEAAPAGEQALGAQFLLVGPHPTEDGIPTRAIPYICRFSWPNFEPEITKNGNSAVSIGSGANVPEYRAGIKDALDPKNGLLEGEVGRNGGWVLPMSMAVTQMLMKHQVPGISQHIHVHVAFRGSIEIGTNDRIEHPKDGPKRVIKMPLVAETYQQFVELARNIDIDAAGAVC